MITKEQEARLRAAINNDCAEFARYFNRADHTKTCVIGALIRKEYIDDILTDDGGAGSLNAASVILLPHRVLQQLMADTGLDAYQLRRLQSANDSVLGNSDEAVRLRRSAVHRRLDTILAEMREL